MNRTCTARLWFKWLLIAGLVSFGISFTPAGVLWAQDASGLSLKLYSDPENPTNEYTLSEDDASENAIKLIMVLNNISDQQINTERGFSQVELHRALIVTNPCGGVMELSPEGEDLAFDAPPPRFQAGQPLVPAEILRSDFVKSLTINDLRQLFPLMKTLPGKYTVAAQQSGARFIWTKTVKDKGLHGVANHRSNWFGTIHATTNAAGEEEKTSYTILILPVSGARLQVRVEDTASETPEPLFDVQVKVFQTADIPADSQPADSWTAIESVLSGSTDTKGDVVWGSCDSCMPAGDYTIIAKNKDEYQVAQITSSDSGWDTGCSGVITKSISYGEPVVTAKFSIFALNSVQLNIKSVVLSGDIGAKTESTGLYNSGIEVSVGIGARANDGVKIFGDTVRIGKRARVYDVYYNELENRGKILGEQITPLELPVWQEPPFLESSPGDKDVRVRPRKTKELAPGDYKNVVVSIRGKLYLTGGTYHFRNLTLGSRASLVCLEPSIIRIKKRLYCSRRAFLGPDSESGLSAKDVLLYIGGINGKSGQQTSYPKAAMIGFNNNVKANLYAPNGTLWIGLGSKAEGSFIAKEVIVGIKAKVKLDSAFQ